MTVTVSSPSSLLLIMRGLALTGIFMLFFMIDAKAQTLFRYGKHSVTKDEFLQAYNKNNTDSNATRLSYSDYLELYSKFKLKVQAALDSKMDTLAEQRNELQAFRYQLAESFLKEDASVKLLVDEAAQRSLKDIRVSHIFIPLDKNANAQDLKAAETKIRNAYDRINKGEVFEEVAAPYNKPELGWVTAFVLPYEFESVIYSTAPGKISEPYRSAGGFHLFKNNEERKAFGRIRVAQILLAYPPGATDDTKKAFSVRADSLHKALQGGADFGKLAGIYSGDIQSYRLAGEIPAFGVGKFDPVFENMAFSLPADSAISHPFETAFGYHILKRLQRIPVVEDVTNKDWLEVIKENVQQSDRMQVAQTILVKNIRDIIKKDASQQDMQCDSAVMEYYRNHLENYNKEFADQFDEFRQGNLLFAIMQKNVWDASSSDSIGLTNFYNAHKEKYFWENSADALVITCTDPKEVDRAQLYVKNNLNEWRKWVDQSDGMVQADSGRFELSQIPVIDRTNFTEGLITAPVTNEQDSSKTFACIIKLYKNKTPKSFEEAKGAVINDYQEYLEQEWVNGLKKKYRLKVNKKVLNSLED